ncbi:hypothetical protein Q31b_11710 [Novipirellula aureliae]|uniref:SHOCT domain-containing protein n=1 Tax=Novipirellula aureliae TaxID=2527966 RepID=A0A5C6EC33_9BACT|nr:hypothetical protein Q31b_11710 [Novipirellula aureliae]
MVQNLSNRYGLSADAVTHMLVAVSNGNGSMAQFSHPEFGGSGQWMQGGMTMVSDLFNNHLKNLVNNLCSDIAAELASHQLTQPTGSFQSQSQGGTHCQSQMAGMPGSTNELFVPDPNDQWWPQDLGTPRAVGSQNSTKYAYFPEAHRLAVTTGGEPWVYDTLNHQIGGFGQQQGGSGSITFSSQFGTVDLATLPLVARGNTKVDAPSHSAPVSFDKDPTTVSVEAAANVKGQPASADDILGTIERLGTLREKGLLSDEEFAAKKAELLSRL